MNATISSNRFNAYPVSRAENLVPPRIPKEMGLKSALKNISKNIIFPIANICTAFLPIKIMVPSGIGLSIITSIQQEDNTIQDCIEGRILKQLSYMADGTLKKIGIHSQPAEKFLDNSFATLNATTEIISEGTKNIVSDIRGLGIKESLFKWHRDCTNKRDNCQKKTKTNHRIEEIWKNNKEKTEINKNPALSSAIRKFSNEFEGFGSFIHNNPNFMKNYCDIMGKNPASPHHLIATSHPEIYKNDKMQDVRKLRRIKHLENIEILSSGFSPKQTITNNLEEKIKRLQEGLYDLTYSRLTTEHQKTQMSHSNNHIVEATINNMKDFHDILNDENFDTNHLSITEHYFKDTINQFNALLKTCSSNTSLSEQFEEHFTSKPIIYNQDEIFSKVADTMPHENKEDTKFMVSGHSHPIDKKKLKNMIHKGEISETDKIHFKINEPEIDKETHQAILAYEIYKKNRLDIHNQFGVPGGNKITTAERLLKNINLFFMPNNNLETNETENRIFENPIMHHTTNMLTHIGASIAGFFVPVNQTYSKLQQGFKNIITQRFFSLDKILEEDSLLFSAYRQASPNVPDIDIDKDYIKKFHRYTNLTTNVSLETVEKIANWFKDSLRS